MKGKIDKHGFLYIERGNGIYQKQMCPYDSSDKMLYCGDWCALFEEPKMNILILDEDEKPEHLDYLSICKKDLYFNQFTDERKDPNNYKIDIQADLVQEICKRYWDLQERIEIIENIANQIDSSEYESKYSKKDEEFAKDSIEIMQRTIKVLKNLEGNIIEFDDNEGE